jgi:LSD1 subclass zinc finger protein
VLSSDFDANVRILICGECGAALPPTPLGGGQVACSYCHTVTVVNPRSDVSLATGPVDEAQRMASLWSQIGRGMSVNVQVAALIENGMLPARNVTAALQMWQSVRATQVTNPAAVKDSLLTITALLADYYLVNGDVARVRAFYESALEACHEPRHQQWLRGSMCSSAARVGDFDAAGRWLSACNPQPPDLMSDTSYRVAYAYLATAQNRFCSPRGGCSRTFSGPTPTKRRVIRERQPRSCAPSSPAIPWPAPACRPWPKPTTSSPSAPRPCQPPSADTPAMRRPALG